MMTLKIGPKIRQYFFMQRRGVFEVKFGSIKYMYIRRIFFLQTHVVGMGRTETTSGLRTPDIVRMFEN